MITANEKYLIDRLKDELIPEQLRNFRTMTLGQQMVIALQVWTEYCAFPDCSSGEAYSDPSQVYEALRLGLVEARPVSATTLKFHMRKEEIA